MHAEVLEWVSRFSSQRADITVLDIGGRNINGTCKQLFPNARYVALDIVAADGVDIVADAADWNPNEEFDVVVSTEVFEHAERWPDIVRTAFRACKPGGMFIVTAATHGRAVHSASGKGTLDPGEWYENVDSEKLRGALIGAGFVDVMVEVGGFRGFPEPPQRHRRRDRRERRRAVAEAEQRDAAEAAEAAGAAAERPGQDVRAVSYRALEEKKLDEKQPEEKQPEEKQPEEKQPAKSKSKAKSKKSEE